MMDDLMYSPEEIRHYHVRAIVAMVKEKLDIKELNEVEYHVGKFKEMNTM